MRDIDIRQALLQEMARIHEGQADTLIIEELGLCQGIARVDIAVVNGSLHGYEIKSERDTLIRLPAQCDVYSRSLEFVTIVVSIAHLSKVRDLVPKWWGIWCAVEKSGIVSLRVLRKGKRNPKLVSLAVAQLLWRDEALEALTQRNLDKGLRSKSREIIWLRLASVLPPSELGDIVRDCLKNRGENWRSRALLT